MITFKDIIITQRQNDLNMLKIKKQLTDIILTLQDNPNITRINNQCFIISSANLSNDLCLTPEYYDFKRQYRLIVRIIEECSTEKAQSLMNNIVNKGSIRYPSDIYHKFHPDVIKQVNLLLN